MSGMTSIKEIYKIGRGPSSSHTIGPERACKIFKEQTGETLLNRFNRLKTEEAKRLLKNTDLSATEISLSLGFTEPKYFGAVFKKFTGVSPMAYKKEHYGKTY